MFLNLRRRFQLWKVLPIFIIVYLSVSLLNLFYYFELNNLDDWSNIAENDPRLVRIIKDRFLDPPSTLRRVFPRITATSDGQDKIVDFLFNKKDGGVFVESGAYDGVYLSNTLQLELHRKWRGLLIEPDPFSYKELREKHRRVYSSNSCLSTARHPQKVSMQMSEVDSKIIVEDNMDKMGNGFEIDEVQCFPLYSLLLAANMTTVDYFSLDIEGQELQVLKTVPWDKVDIKVVSVEHRHSPEGKEAFVEFMNASGYNLYRDLYDIDGIALDVIFVKNDFDLPASHAKFDDCNSKRGELC